MTFFFFSNGGIKRSHKAEMLSIVTVFLDYSCPGPSQLLGSFLGMEFFLQLGRLKSELVAQSPVSFILSLFS